MFKFIVQGQEIDEVVSKLRELTTRLEGTKTEKVVTTKKEIKVTEFKNSKGTVEDYEEIETPVSDIEMSDPRAEVEEVAVVLDGELDSAGFPWDARIHASSKAKIANGTWRVKRGVEDEVVAKTQASFRGSVQQPTTPTNVQPIAPTVSQPIVEQQAVVQAPVSPVAPPLPTMNSGHTVTTFIQNFPLILAGLITEGKVNQEYVNSLKTHFKVDQIWMINDAQKAEVFESFAQHGLITKVG